MSYEKLASSSDSVCVWSLPSTNPISHRPHGKHNVNCLAWSPSNQVIATGGDDGQIVLSLPTGSTICTLTQQASADKAAVLSVAFSSSSKYLATGDAAGHVKLWDLRKKDVATCYKDHRKAVSSVCFNSDDSLLASAGVAGDVYIWEMAKPAPPLHFRIAAGQAIRSLQFSSHKKNLIGGVSDDGSVHLWDTTTKRLHHSFIAAHQGPATSLCFSPKNQSLLASAGLDKSVVLYDVEEKKIIKVISAEAAITCVTFMSDGITLAAGTAQGSILVFNLRTSSSPTLSFEAHSPHPVLALSFAASKRISAPKTETPSTQIASQTTAQSSTSTATTPMQPPSSTTTSVLNHQTAKSLSTVTPSATGSKPPTSSLSQAGFPASRSNSTGNTSQTPNVMKVSTVSPPTSGPSTVTPPTTLIGDDIHGNQPVEDLHRTARASSKNLSAAPTGQALGSLATKPLDSIPEGPHSTPLTMKSTVPGASLAVETAAERHTFTKSTHSYSVKFQDDLFTPDARATAPKSRLQNEPSVRTSLGGSPELRPSSSSSTLLTTTSTLLAPSSATVLLDPANKKARGSELLSGIPDSNSFALLSSTSALPSFSQVDLTKTTMTPITAASSEKPRHAGTDTVPTAASTKSGKPALLSAQHQPQAGIFSPPTSESQSTDGLRLGSSASHAIDTAPSSIQLVYDTRSHGKLSLSPSVKPTPQVTQQYPTQQQQQPQLQPQLQPQPQPQLQQQQQPQLQPQQPQLQRPQLQRPQLVREFSTPRADQHQVARAPLADIRPNIPQSSPFRADDFQASVVKNLVEDCLESFRYSIHQDVQNLHVELLRQFHIQKNQMQQMLRMYSVNEDLVREVKRLREENEILKSPR